MRTFLCASASAVTDNGLPLVLVVDDLADLVHVDQHVHQADQRNEERQHWCLQQENSDQSTSHDHSTSDLDVAGTLTDFCLALTHDIAIVLIIEHEVILPMLAHHVRPQPAHQSALQSDSPTLPRHLLPPA